MALNLALVLSFCKPNISLANPKIESAPEFNSPQAILNLNQLAEIEFLEGDLQKAFNTYQAITNQVLDSKWSSEIRNIMFQSFFRLAQIDKPNEKLWVKKALAFASDLKPNTETTPVGLVNVFNQLVNSNEVLSLSFINPLVLVNGSENLKIVFKDKIYRVDHKSESDLNSEFVSPDFVRGYELVEYKPKLKPKLPLELPLKTTPVLVVDKSLTHTDTLNLEANLNEPNPITKNTQSLAKKRRNNRWIYISSAVLAVTLGAVLINQRNDNSDTYEPAAREGF